MRRLGEHVRFYKLGMELFATADGHRMLDWLLARDKQVFVDMKLFDIPRTVAAAVRGLCGRGIRFVSVHSASGALDEAVAAAAGDGMGVLAITVLTSMDARRLNALGISGTLADTVASRSRMARAAGCAGVVCSAQETRRLRRELGDSLLAVTPGIRAGEHRGHDDQKRVAHVAEALANGSDYLVVGRPILNAEDPARAAAAMQEAIRAALEGTDRGSPDADCAPSRPQGQRG